jgi:hypothetical protein
LSIDNEFYSMLMEDTPGYVPSEHWSKPPIQELSSAMSRNDGRIKSASRSSKSPECSSKSPIKNLDESSSVMKQASSSSRESSRVGQHGTHVSPTL